LGNGHQQHVYLINLHLPLIIPSVARKTYFKRTILRIRPIPVNDRLPHGIFKNSVICLKYNFTNHLEILNRFKNEKSENNLGNPSSKKIPVNLKLRIREEGYLVLISERWSAGNRDRVRMRTQISGNCTTTPVPCDTDDGSI
jgi:hypothetical protein